MRALLVIVLALLLVAAQAAILAQGLFRPNVSDAYRAKFIDQTTTEWPGTTDTTTPSQQ